MDRLTQNILNVSRARLWAVLFACVTLFGCGATESPAPLGRTPDPSLRRPAANTAPRQASRNASQHVVRSGETLYAIAWRYGKDFRQVAEWNGIQHPFQIWPGQRLRLKPTPRASAPSSTQPNASRSASKSAANRVPRPASSAPGPRIGRWQWPARGEVIGRFGAQGGKGINIAGRTGQSILAAAPGKVVYSGSGLRGYGKLIIIKHNNRFLSAYAHNQRLHVKEGDTVQRGQRVAEMGRSGSKRVMLHFEIRRDGKPVDPIKYLPG